jgi:hypothetical protein
MEIISLKKNTTEAQRHRKGREFGMAILTSVCVSVSLWFIFPWLGYTVREKIGRVVFILSR